MQKIVVYKEIRTKNRCLQRNTYKKSLFIKKSVQKKLLFIKKSVNKFFYFLTKQMRLLCIVNLELDNPDMLDPEIDNSKVLTSYFTFYFRFEHNLH